MIEVDLRNFSYSCASILQRHNLCLDCSLIQKVFSAVINISHILEHTLSKSFDLLNKNSAAFTRITLEEMYAKYTADCL